MLAQPSCTQITTRSQLDERSHCVASRNPRLRCRLPSQPRSMHDFRGDSAPISPYASMSIPFFDRQEAAALSEVAAREYSSLSNGVSTDGLVAKIRETDKASLHKMKNPGAPVDAASTKPT
ncbi:uncharacterized protein JCM10292_003979 [Rhodotorula paludigena]|uniref:uncharacterized protein n=1 Tax=Rhodotorula paludigena TaxID=86838 RepID=UPI0031709E4B